MILYAGPNVSTMQAWDFRRAETCFSCGKEAIQRIEMCPGEIIITCMNCGAAKHYTVSGVYVGETFDEDVERG